MTCWGRVSAYWACLPLPSAMQQQQQQWGRLARISLSGALWGPTSVRCWEMIGRWVWGSHPGPGVVICVGPLLSGPAQMTLENGDSSTVVTIFHGGCASSRCIHPQSKK